MANKIRKNEQQHMNTIDDDIIDIEELSRRLKRDVRSLRRDVANHSIPVMVISRRCHRFSWKEILKWLESKTIRPDI